MTMPAEDAASALSENRNTSHVDWPAIIAGAIIASAISLVLLTFGSAVGLTLTSPFESEGMSAVGIAVALAIWLVIVQVWSFLAGGYVTGRMRRRAYDATEHESDVRDGMHGLLVWGTGVIIGGLILASGGSGLLGATAQATGGVAKSAIDKIGDAAGDTNPISYVVDTAFRSKQAPQDNTAADDSREEATAIVTRDLLDGDISADDKAYIAQLISQQTGIPPEEAQKRVDTMVTNAQGVVDDAKAAAKRAKNFAVVAAFIAAASLAISAVAAFFAAGVGGRHRDEGTVVAVWFDRLR